MRPALGFLILVFLSLTSPAQAEFTPCQPGDSNDARFCRFYGALIDRSLENPAGGPKDREAYFKLALDQYQQSCDRGDAAGCKMAECHKSGACAKLPRVGALKKLCSENVPEACAILAFAEPDTCWEGLKRACDLEDRHCLGLSTYACKFFLGAKGKDSPVDELSEASRKWLFQKGSDCAKGFGWPPPKEEPTDAKRCELGCLAYCGLGNGDGGIPADIQVLRKSCRAGRNSSCYQLVSYENRADVLCPALGGDPCFKRLFPKGVPVPPAPRQLWKEYRGPVSGTPYLQLSCKTGSKAACEQYEKWKAFESDADAIKCMKEAKSCKPYVASLLERGDVAKAIGAATNFCGGSNDPADCDLMLTHPGNVPGDWMQQLLTEYEAVCHERFAISACILFAESLLARDKPAAQTLLRRNALGWGPLVAARACKDLGYKTTETCEKTIREEDRRANEVFPVSEKDLKKVLTANSATLRVCSAAPLLGPRSKEKSAKKLDGKVVITLDVNYEGRVVTSVVRSLTGNPKASACILNQLNKWTFPKTPGRKNRRSASVAFVTFR